MNNYGYGIIKQFQDLYLESRFVASSKAVCAPNYGKIAKAYGIKYIAVNQDKLINKTIAKVIMKKEPYICDIFLHPEQKIIPKLAFGNPIEDLSPKLSRAEFNENMVISTIQSDKKIIESN